MNILTLFVALMGLLPMLVHGFWKMPCYGTVVRERIDPVVNPGIVADHVQRVVGGSGINFTMDANVTRHAGCSSCTVKQDKSNYYVPQLYSIEPSHAGPIYSLVQDGSVNITYTQIHNDQETIKPFPEGLTMTAGNPSRRSSFGDDIENAISFRCDGGTVESHNLPEHCVTVIASIRFPSCWNGYDVNSDEIAHMSYDTEGKCPSTHPVRVMTLRYDFQFDTSNLKHPRSSDQLIFSTADTTGYGFHGAFVNGWDTEALTAAIETCLDTDTGDIATTCPALSQYDADQCMDCKVPPRVDEPIDKVPALPGCHPVSVGDSEFHQDCSENPSEVITNYQISYEDLTRGGWQYEGCSSSADPFGWNGNMNKGGGHVGGNPLLKPAWCMIWCKENMEDTPYAWFALQGGQCICSKLDPQPENLPAVGFLGNCDDPCPGNNSFSCGGLNSTSLYKYCGDDCHNSEFEQWPHHPKTFPKRNLPAIDFPEVDEDGFLSIVTEINPSSPATTVISPGSSSSSEASSATTTPAVSGARIESPYEQSVFIGYKVCARSLVSLSKDEDEATYPNDDSITCSIVEGPRAESVAAAFTDWAIAEYALDRSRAAYYASLEDVLDARVARLRLAELHRMRPRVMGVDAVLAVVLVSCICLLGFAVCVAKQKQHHDELLQRRAAAVLRADVQLATRLLDMDPAVLEMLFAKYAAVKDKADEVERKQREIADQQDHEKDYFHP